MSLVARHLEANGIPTVVFSVARDITESVFTPRAVFTNYPLGNPCGRPGDPENQRAILRTGLRLLEQATASGTVVATPYEWSPNHDWMRLIFSDEQPFLTDEAEQQRQAELERARRQKAERRRAQEQAAAPASGASAD